MARQTFKSLEPEIRSAIDAIIIKPDFPRDPKGYTLIEGFVHQFVQDATGSGVPIALAGQVMPVVSIIGNSTGRVFYFNVKFLLPKVKFE